MTQGTKQRRLARLVVCVGCTVALIAALNMGEGRIVRAGDGFQKPAPEELSMSSLPGFPGAAAVVLAREEKDTDDLHTQMHYERIKILTEDGKKYANVEIRFVRTSDNDEYDSNDMSVDDVQGRTIHPDGTIIPFTGKPYKKTIEKTKEIKYQAIVFTLPDVEVGSIIEYRYSKRWSDYLFEAPEWYIQGDLYVKSAHYVWYPTTRNLVDSKQRPVNSIAWFPILPAGAEIKHSETPGSSVSPSKQTYELTIKNVPPTVTEEYMPPLKSYTYRVLFSMTAFRSGDEFWKSVGKDWSKGENNFMKQSGELDDATRTIIAGAATSEEKLRKIYAKVMTFENTDFTREHTRREDGKVTNVTDVYKSGRGTPSQLTALFVAMARSAGLQASLMRVPDRSIEYFIPKWLDTRQFDALIAIANVDGKDWFFDPGSRYCSFGHLAWEHNFVSGLRQTSDGTAFAETPGEGYATNRTSRVANLDMDEHGEVKGKVDVKFSGTPALRWRHIALRGDEESLKDRLRTMLEEEIPRSLEVKVLNISGLSDYEQPLAVSFEVKGTLGAPTGKRLVLPVDFFESGSVSRFSSDKRETPIDFEYTRYVQDALRLNFKRGFEVEAAPKPEKFDIPTKALYNITVDSTPTSITTRRNYAMGEFLFLAKDYPTVQKFYAQLQAKDKESVVLKIVPTSTSGN